MSETERNAPAGRATLPFVYGSTDWCRAAFNASTGLANLAAKVPQSQTVGGLRTPDNDDGPISMPVRTLVLRLAAHTLLQLFKVVAEGRMEGTYGQMVRHPAAVLAAGIITMMMDPTETKADDLAQLPQGSIRPIIDQYRRASFPSGEVAPLLLLAASRATGKELAPIKLDKRGAFRGWRAGVEAVVQRVEADPRVEPRTRYNLACYLVDRGEYDRALEQLTLSVPSNPLLQAWAEKDPSLQALRKRRSDEWERLFPQSPPPAPSGSSNLPNQKPSGRE